MNTVTVTIVPTDPPGCDRIVERIRPWAYSAGNRDIRCKDSVWWRRCFDCRPVTRPLGDQLLTLGAELGDDSSDAMWPKFLAWNLTLAALCTAAHDRGAIGGWLGAIDTVREERQLKIPGLG